MEDWIIHVPLVHFSILSLFPPTHYWHLIFKHIIDQLECSSSSWYAVTHIRHILGEQVLKCLPHSVTLSDNAFTTLIPGAARVSHQRCPAYDTLQPLLQWRASTNLVVSQRLHHHPLLQWPCLWSIDSIIHINIVSHC